MDIVDKLRIHERPITVSCISGGYADIPITRDDVITFLSLDLNCSIYDWVDFKFQLEEVKKVYSSPESILSSYVISNNNMYLDSWDNIRVIPIQRYIDIIYRMTDVKKVLSKKDFLQILGFEFLFIAKINYELALEKYQKERNISTKKKEKPTKGLVYLLKIEDRDEYKIGVTTNLDKRVTQLSTQMPFELEIINTIKSNDIYQLESELHSKFEDKNINGEWFELTNRDISYIKKIPSEF